MAEDFSGANERKHNVEEAQIKDLHAKIGQLKQMSLHLSKLLAIQSDPPVDER